MNPEQWTLLALLALTLSVAIAITVPTKEAP